MGDDVLKNSSIEAEFSKSNEQDYEVVVLSIDDDYLHCTHVKNFRRDQLDIPYIKAEDSVILKRNTALNAFISENGIKKGDLLGGTAQNLGLEGDFLDVKTVKGGALYYTPPHRFMPEMPHQ